MSKGRTVARRPSPEMSTVSVSAIVLTYNEEDYLGECLESLTWCDEVWVVDSFSTDRTLEIASKYTTKIVQHPFENFSRQRNWALEDLAISAEWIVFVDSDERITPELREEISGVLGQTPEQVCGYYIPRKQLFWGKWLRFGECWPAYNLRLFRRGSAQFQDREVHESIIVQGKKRFLKSPIVHICRESMSEVVDRLNAYTTLEATRMYRTGQYLYEERSSPSYSRLRAAVKRFSRYLPCKPLLKFIWTYIFRQGFRDGRLGFVHALMDALYVFVAGFKLWELKTGLTSVPEERETGGLSDSISSERPATRPGYDNRGQEN